MYYIGLMAGTSFDGVDVALVKDNILIASHYLSYDNYIKNQLRQLTSNTSTTLANIAELDIMLGQNFATTTNQLLSKTKIQPQEVIAIGSHGQTIYHAPCKYSWQIANPNIIAQQTGITVVADFRMADISAGGQGAPLTPVYHQHLLQGNNGIIINLGGITNITIVKGNNITGFDSGPANTLLNNWIKKHQNKDYDKDGKWASSGQIITPLLDKLLADKYFKQAPPKSTGFEYFNLDWLTHYLTGNENPADVQATLLALTTHSIKYALATFPTDKELPIYLCGGGVHNTALVRQLKNLCQNPIQTTQALGIDSDYLEAAAFAYFAQQTLAKKPSNHPDITGANGKRILGGIYHSSVI